MLRARPGRPVLTILHPFDPWGSTVGGIHSVVRQFLKYAPASFAVRLIGVRERAALAPGVWHECAWEGRPFAFLPVCTIGDDNFRKPIPTALRYTAALAGRRVVSDFLHFHRIETALATATWPGERTLFIHNDTDAQLSEGSGRSAVLWKRLPAAYRTLEKALVGQFQTIYVCHRRTTERYRLRYPDLASRILHLSNAFDDGIFAAKPAERRHKTRTRLALELGLSPDTRFVLFVGRLHAQKDPLLLVAAFARLAERCPEAHLLIAGDGDLGEVVRLAIAARRLTARVSLLGALPQASLARLYRAAHVSVLTSLYEGMPLCVLESLASGTPVVSTDCDEVSALVGTDCGEIVPVRDPERVADALARQIATEPPTAACVRRAAPFAARSRIEAVYGAMAERHAREVLYGGR